MEYYNANQVDGLIQHLSNGINKHAPIANDYIATTIGKHTLEVVKFDE